MAIDFFLVDQSRMPTFVECKRYKDALSRREVIGRMLEYAANGQYYWQRDDLNRYAEESAKRSGETLEDAMNSLQPEAEKIPEEFLDNVFDSLKEGQIRMIFSSKRLTWSLRVLRSS